jgi:hypothetical protein
MCCVAHFLNIASIARQAKVFDVKHFVRQVGDNCSSLEWQSAQADFVPL